MGQTKANFPLKKFVGKTIKVFSIFRAGVRLVVFSNLLLLDKKFSGRKPRCVKLEMIEKRNFFED